MYIRKASRTVHGKTYFNYLLVESHLTPQGPRQKVICSLGDLSPRPQGAMARTRPQTRECPHRPAGPVCSPPCPDPELETLVAKVKAGPRRRRAQQDQQALAASVDPGKETIAVLTGAVRSKDSRKAGPVHVGYQFWQRLGIDAILKAAGLSERARQLTCAMALNR